MSGTTGQPMGCPQCGQETPPGVRFCSACGARLPAGCPACGHANAPGSRYCSDCGQALSPAPAGAQTRRFATPDAYTPPHLAERILTTRPALEGERKQVTVLFADLKGSMELLADRDPEDARALLDPVLTRMMEAVHRYEGTVNQVMGDGIMALFGAPLAHEDHAVRACYAVLRMQESVSRYADEVQRTHGVPIQMRVGLNSGEVVVRSIGNDLHMDYTAVGQTTHLAARMEQMAKPGSALMTGETLKLAEGYVDARRLGPIPVKGLTAPVDVFELIGTGRARSRLHAAAARGLSPFVGRDAELQQLTRARERAREGHGQVVAVVGEPGVGKTRLFFEFVRSAGTEGWLLLETQTASHGKATAYLPIIQLVRRYCHIEDGEAPDRMAEKVAAKALSLDDRLKDAMPAILFLLEALPEDHPFRSLDEAQRRGRVQDAVRRLLLRETQRQPVLVIVESLHWLDRDSQALLDSLIESLPTVRLLLLVSYRPEFQHGWANKSHYTRVWLDPLPRDSAAVLLDALLGNEAGLQPLEQLLITRTQGNPFFLEESVRTLVETGALVGERGAYRLAKALHAVQVPATVHAVLAARIDRLQAAEKQLLQAASVIGTDVPLPLLEAIAELPEAVLHRGLGQLQASEFLYEKAVFPEPGYAFKHALTHEVAYGSLLQEQRRALHARVVEAFERLYPDRLAEQGDWLAQHVARGELWAKARRYFRAAGDTEPPTTMAAFSLWLKGDYDAALRRGQRDLAAAAEFGNFGMAVIGRLRLAQIHHALADHPRAIRFLEENVALLDGDLARERFGMPGMVSVLSRAWLARCLAERGDFAEGLAHGQVAAEIAEAADDGYSIAVACWGVGSLHVIWGNPDSAMPVLERALKLSEVASLRTLFPFVALPLGAAYTQCGRPADAVPLLTRAVEEATAADVRAHQPARLAGLAEAHLWAGRPEAARPLARQALDLAREQRARGHAADAQRLLGEIAARQPDADLGEAEARFQEAFALAEELALRPLGAHCRLGRGVVCRRAGKLEQARADLTAAAREYRAMSMSLWSSRAESELTAAD